jgi:hypothetical protein
MTELRVFDATGGFGSDAVRMAVAGCSVTVAERNLIMFALLRDGLQRARDGDFSSAYKKALHRINLLDQPTDSRTYLTLLLNAPPEHRPHVVVCTKQSGRD